MNINVDLNIIGKLLLQHCISVIYFRKNGYDSGRRDAVCNILTKPGIPRKLVPLIKTCLNEMYSTACTINMSDTFPEPNGLKQDVLPPL